MLVQNIDLRTDHQYGKAGKTPLLYLPKDAGDS